MQQPQTYRRVSSVLLGAGGREGKEEDRSREEGRQEQRVAGAPHPPARPPAAGSHAPLSAGSWGPGNGIQEAEILPRASHCLVQICRETLTVIKTVQSD